VLFNSLLEELALQIVRVRTTLSHRKHSTAFVPVHPQFLIACFAFSKEEVIDFGYILGPFGLGHLLPKKN